MSSSESLGVRVLCPRTDSNSNFFRLLQRADTRRGCRLVVGRGATCWDPCLVGDRPGSPQVQRRMSPVKCLPDVTFAKGKPAGARPAMLTLLCSAALVLGAWPCAGASIASLVSDPPWQRNPNPDPNPNPNQELLHQRLLYTLWPRSLRLAYTY